jgi:hypothetical protein
MGEIVERSPSHFLMRDEDGWALWGVDQDADEPLLTFDPDAAGEERARRAFTIRTKETRRIRVLVVLAVVAGLGWAGLRIVALLHDRFGEDPRFVPFGDAVLGGRLEGGEIRLWLELGSSVAYALFTVSVGLFLVAWLHRRWRREG